MNYRDLEIIEELRRNGSITEEAYQAERQKILEQMNKPSTEFLYWGMAERSYVALMHVAQFGGYIVPFLGFILPVIMWMINKDKSVTIDLHGKNIINFMISWIIYAIVAGILCVVLIGIPMLIALGVMQVVFIILAAIKASNNEYWKYPFSITFIR